MSVPAPPYPPAYLSSQFAQAGGPITITSGSTSSAVTFSPSIPTNYQLALEWIGVPPTQGYRTATKTMTFALLEFYGTVVGSQFNWRVFRIA